MNWYFHALQNYANFGGRARRREYWFFRLFDHIIVIILVIIDMVIGSFDYEVSIGLLSGIYSLLTLIPNLSVLARRLHDTGHKARWMLVLMIPFIGIIMGIIIFFWTLQDSQMQRNDYGVSPKYDSVDYTDTEFRKYNNVHD